MNKIPTKETTT